MILGNRWELGELIAVSWNDEMAERFPNADHTSCRQELHHDGNDWQPFSPVRCHGPHCNRCGAPTDCQGGHNCPDRPEVS
ncbi:hypothetical protein [Mycobacterium phage WXIN]|nr:hypothetical protein [Mycobacterium phage WXIN]